MGLFTRQPSGVDLRDRDYVLTGCPVVAQDDLLVLVDLTVRLAVRPPRDDESYALGYDSADERAIHAVCVLVLRQLGIAAPSDELLVGRGRIVEAVEQGLTYAPVGAGVKGRVAHVEVRPYDAAGATFDHEFRVVSRP
ncbi:hypothetical protein [Nocardioides lacusdianchii]|uniref:hypothetical protein n=1 Tax=Nocardioides lacusdianchii TaxID=2783664 RepID=UPI001CCCFD4E|nr:hypothetical protein [Nocardioides lacusdianchii]